jgi:hypothetical protein
MMGAVTRCYRVDIGSLRPVMRRDDGTIRVDAFLTKCGVFQYRQPDGSVRRELRLPEDVFDSAAVASFLGVPVTNDHPPDMLTAKNARRFAVGSQVGAIARDDDHMRSTLSVYDDETISAMGAGKTQVSNGYTCDCVETPGVHPLYGVYDAIQKNIRGNHIAIVDRGRAGLTAAARMDRMDGMMVLPGTELAFDPELCKSRAMPRSNPATARLEVVVKTDTQVDPDDEAARNAAGENDAPPAAKRQPGKVADKGGDRAKPIDPDAPDDDEVEGDDEVESEDDEGMYDGDGGLTETGTKKIAAASFALPHKQQLPIHDPKAVKDSMRAFAKHEFDSPDEKHGAFNRIAGKATQFGMDAAAFTKKHAGNLDRADGANKDAQMTPTEIKALEEKAAQRKVKLVAAKGRIDALETENAELKKKLDAADAAAENAKREAAKTPATPENKQDASDASRLDAKLELIDRARAAGATVTTKMSDVEIMRATIKHVDGEDVPADKSDDVVRYVFDGACKRADKDQTATAKGAAALAGARVAIANPLRVDGDADDTDEDAARSRLRADSASRWARKETK